MSLMNKSYIAHIVADKPVGPRGDEVRSDQLKDDLRNLMLLCDQCHRRIDIEQVQEHPEETLLRMKREHEERIELATALRPEDRTHMLLFGSNIGSTTSPLTERSCEEALQNARRLRTTPNPIVLSWRGRKTEDHEEGYWRAEVEELQRQFAAFTATARMSDVNHFSVFALAPQPLLIKLGALLTDQFPADVYQLHREPRATWAWQEDDDGHVYTLNVPRTITGPPVLKLALSATINDDRITEVAPSNATVWSITRNSPHNDHLRSRSQLSLLRKVMRSAMDQIKAVHGEHETLHVFPAMPVSAAVEFGRIRMPKADLPMIIYDQNHFTGGFAPTITISQVQ
jgi:hypothetical protein